MGLSKKKLTTKGKMMKTFQLIKKVHQTPA
jgi:hypothetical protein